MMLDKRDGVVLDYINGLKLEQITKKWKVSVRSIYNYLNKSNVPRRRKLNNYTPEQVQRMIKLYKEGFPLKDIANTFNITTKAVWGVLHRRGVKFNRKNRKLSDEQMRKIIKSYIHGKSAYRLAKRYGVSENTIKNWLRKFGIRLRNVNEVNKMKRQRIKKQNGMTKDKALLFGLLLADGTESKKGSITFTNYDKFLLNLVLDIGRRIYGIRGRIYEGKRMVTKVMFNSLNMLEDLHKYIPTLIHKPDTRTFIPKEIMNNLDFAKIFLKGYYSCDGAVILKVDKRGYLGREVVLNCHNQQLLSDIREILRRLNIKFSAHGTFIEISSQEGLSMFKNEIGFFPVSIRKGVHWKGFKKDKLLELIIRTFSRDFPKHFSSKEEGYNYLKMKYKDLTTKSIKNINRTLKEES